MNERTNKPGDTATTSGTDSAVKSGTNWVSDKVDTVKSGAVDLAETVQDRAKTMAKSFADTAGKAKEKASEWISNNTEPVQHLVEQGYEQGRQMVTDFGRDATAMIRRYPLTAVAIGLGVGLLIGRAAGNRA